MGSGEDNTLAKSSKQTPSAQETPATPSYHDWSASMQAFYGSGATPPPFFTSPVASSPATHPYLWGPQHFIPAYGSPLPYPVIYPHSGYPHPDMAAVHSPAKITTETEEKGPVGKDKKKSKKILGNMDQIGGKSSENEKMVSGSGNDGTSQRSINSAESRSEGSSYTSNENTNQHESSRRSSDMILGNGTNAQNNHLARCSGAATTDIPGTSLDVGMDLRNASPATLPLRVRTNVSGLSSFAPATTVGCQGIVPDHLVSQDERELRREKRKQSNRESARRSRLRKQAECEELQVKVDTLSNENHLLNKELKRLAEECEKLRTENASIEDQLRHFCSSDGISTLEGSHAITIVPQSANGDKNDEEQALNGSTGFSAEKQNHLRCNDNQDSAPS